MQSVVIEQARVELDLDQLIHAIQSLNPHERQLVREALDQDWAGELDEIVARVQARFQAEPMHADEIAAEVEAVRTERYAHRRR